MKAKRMPKGWVHIATNDMSFIDNETKEDKIRRDQRFNKAIRNIEKKSESQLAEEGYKAADERNKRNTELVQALDSGKLKSERMIAEARSKKKESSEK